MTTGVSIFLAAVGAVLAFAVRDSLSGVDLTMVGYILMAAGAVGLVIAVVQAQSARKTNTSVTEQTARTNDGTVRSRDVESH